MVLSAEDIRNSKTPFVELLVVYFVFLYLDIYLYDYFHYHVYVGCIGGMAGECALQGRCCIF